MPNSLFVASGFPEAPPSTGTGGPLVGAKMLVLLRGVHTRPRPRVPSPFFRVTRHPHACVESIPGYTSREAAPVRASARAGIADASRVRLLILANAFPAPDRPAYG